MSRIEQVPASFEAGSDKELSSESVSRPRRVARPGRSWSRRERLVHALAQGVANAVVRKPPSEKLRFGLVSNPEELARVGGMRLRLYQAKLPYLLKELSPDGIDAYDAHSFVFAAWRGERAVATIRATRYPYETLRYVSEPALSRWMEDGWDTDFLEWGRLLVDTSEGLRRLTPALLSYAGLYLLGLSAYRKFFGYARPQSSKSFGGFEFEQNSLSFTIPERGEHAYHLIKGDFHRVMVFSAPRWLASMACRSLGITRGP